LKKNHPCPIHSVAAATEWVGIHESQKDEFVQSETRSALLTRGENL